MANLCSNVLCVKGDKKHLETFKKLYKGKECEERTNWLDFNKIVPDDHESLLDEWNKLDSDNEDKKRYKTYYNYWFNKIGYHLHQKIWGTKWNPIVDEPEFYNGELIYCFQTAWSPSEPIVKELIKKYPYLDFSFEYEEWEEQFAGNIKSEKGNIILEECYNIDVVECIECEHTICHRQGNPIIECDDCGEKFTFEELEAYEKKRDGE